MIYIYDGKILLAENMIAASENCCCGDSCCFCTTFDSAQIKFTDTFSHPFWWHFFNIDFVFSSYTLCQGDTFTATLTLTNNNAYQSLTVYPGMVFPYFGILFLVSTSPAHTTFGSAGEIASACETYTYSLGWAATTFNPGDTKVFEAVLTVDAMNSIQFLLSQSPRGGGFITHPTSSSPNVKSSTHIPLSSTPCTPPPPL